MARFSTANASGVAKFGAIPLGGVGLTNAGRLPFKGNIHVSGISTWCCSSEYSIREYCRSAMRIASENSFQSSSLPLIGAGPVGGSAAQVEKLTAD